MAFLLEAVGGFMMAFAPNYNTILLSVFVMCVGGALYSGTLDALVFDSLKSEGNESKFDKIISNLSSISLIAPAICSIIGGYIYGIDVRLPFLLNAIGYSIGFIASMFLTEPLIDSEKFSFANFASQTKHGFVELFKNSDIKFQTILMLSIGFIVVISSEMVDSFLSFEFGFTDKQMGILWSAIFILSALASQLTPYIKKIFGLNKALFVVGLFMAVTFIISPYIGLIVGGITLILRSSSQGIFGNLSSIVINNNTDSKYRATTISTFNMIKNVPYVLTAYYIGGVSDLLSARTVSMYLGIALLGFIVISLFRQRRNSF